MWQGGHRTRRLAAPALICIAALGPGAEASANGAPSVPSLVGPADGATLTATGPQLFTVRSHDPDGDPYTGWITVVDATSSNAVSAFRTAPARSGQSSSGVPLTRLPRGSYTWSATAADALGASSASSASRTFSVGGAQDAGGGLFTGEAAYSPSPAPVGSACGSTSFSVRLVSAAAVVSFAPTQYAGSLTFTGGGTSSCETTTSGTGTLTLSASGLGVAATTIACPRLTGQYTRIGGHVESIVSGECTLNDSTTDLASFHVEAVLVPDNGLGPIAGAALDGAFTLSPA